MTNRSGYIHSLVHVNRSNPDPTIPPCHDCGRSVDDYYTEPNRCAGCNSEREQAILRAVHGGEIYRTIAGVWCWQNGDLSADEVRSLDYGRNVTCRAGGTAHLTTDGFALLRA
jgi:hypothetical protein